MLYRRALCRKLIHGREKNWENWFGEPNIFVDGRGRQKNELIQFDHHLSCHLQTGSALNRNKRRGQNFEKWLT